MNSTFPLEPSMDEMRRIGERALDYVSTFIAERSDAPSVDLDGAVEMASGLREAAPEAGAEFSELLGLLEKAASRAIDTTGPGYLGYIPGGGLFIASIANLIASAINRFVAISAPAPALAQMEWNVIDWFSSLFNFPETAKGVLTTGGSLANFSAIVTARRDRLSEDFLNGTIYVSNQAHHSVDKAAYIAGFPERNLRHVPVKRDLRIDPTVLSEMIAEDRRAGSVPFLLIGNAGTTNTGAVDPLETLAQIAREEGLWFHVDAAYGGFFHLTERGRARLAGIERADSIALDPHKGMFLPYGTGCLLVRDGEAMRRAHSAGHAGYLQDLQGLASGDFAEYSPELSRNFRGLAVWLAIKLHGLSSFREALDEKLDLARYVYDELREAPGFKVPWEPELSITAFRFLPEGGDSNHFNVRLLERINSSKRVFISSTEIDKNVILRAAILCHRTHIDRIKEAVDIFKSSAAALSRTDRLR
jgi:aromatic-L-amino-acid decarboxylase